MSVAPAERDAASFPQPSIVNLLLRAISTAHVPAKWLVSLCALMLLMATTRESTLPYSGWFVEPVDRLGLKDAWLTHPSAAAAELLERAARPLWWTIVPWGRLFSGEARWADVWTIAATMLVMLMAGAILSRLSLPVLAGRDRPTLVQAVGSMVGRLPTLLGATCAPAIGVGVFAAIGRLVGMLYRTAGGTATWAGSGVFLIALLGAVPLLWLLVGWVAAWPLMVVAVATEGSDVLDILSRSYGYVMRRKALLLFLVLLSWLVLAGGLVALHFMLGVLVMLASWAMGLSESEATALHLSWLGISRALMASWAVSAFWSLVGAIYLILRREIDGTSVYQVSGQTSRIDQ